MITPWFNVFLTVVVFFNCTAAALSDHTEKSFSILSRVFANSFAGGLFVSLAIVAVGMSLSTIALHQFWIRFLTYKFHLRPISLAETYAVITILGIFI